MLATLHLKGKRVPKALQLQGWSNVAKKLPKIAKDALKSARRSAAATGGKRRAGNGSTQSDILHAEQASIYGQGRNTNAHVSWGEVL